MRDRTLAIVLTVVIAFLLGCPGLAFLCFGVTDFIDYYTLQSYIFGMPDSTTANVFGLGGLCLGIFFIAVVVVAAYFLLRKKPEAPIMTPPPSFTPPIPSEPPAPPTPPETPEPPTPPEPPKPEEPLPPVI